MLNRLLIFQEVYLFVEQITDFSGGLFICRTDTNLPGRSVRRKDTNFPGALFGYRTEKLHEKQKEIHQLILNILSIVCLAVSLIVERVSTKI